MRVGDGSSRAYILCSLVRQSRISILLYIHNIFHIFSNHEPFFYIYTESRVGSLCDPSALWRPAVCRLCSVQTPQVPHAQGLSRYGRLQRRYNQSIFRTARRCIPVSAQRPRQLWALLSSSGTSRYRGAEVDDYDRRCHFVRRARDGSTTKQDRHSQHHCVFRDSSAAPRLSFAQFQDTVIDSILNNTLLTRTI